MNDPVNPASPEFGPGGPVRQPETTITASSGRTIIFNQHPAPNTGPMPPSDPATIIEAGKRALPLPETRRRAAEAIQETK
ncbi:hypothetical protein HYU93_00865 [Candidatus Daviesbacteria bacterium]|nr:hypothetical protein [Candidatus Daviesbacteria bacterium]